MLLQAQKLIHDFCKHATKKERFQFYQAWKIAEKSHKHQFRKSGEPYIVHPISVAQTYIKNIKIMISQ